MFSWSQAAYTSEALVKILMKEHDSERLCISQPINVAHSVTFLIDTLKIKDRDNSKCDDMGSWRHNGSPKKRFKVKHNDDGSIKKIEQVKKKNANGSSHIYTLKKICYVNNSSNDVRKIICSLFGKCKQNYKQCQYKKT